MKRFALTLACLSAAILFGTSLSAQKYEYPFQNPDLSEEERVENLPVSYTHLTLPTICSV